MCGITSLRSVFPSSAGRHRPKRKRVLRAQDCFFRTMPLLTKASFRRRVTARKKRPTYVERFCFGRDSVGIRTQDPQLRRLLLYPTELPNRSLCFPFYRKVAAKVIKNFVIASGYFDLIKNITCMM